MLVLEDETEDLIQRFSAVSLMDCGKYNDLSSADNLRKWFGPRSGPTEGWSSSGSKQFDTLIVFLKGFFEKLILKKKSADDKGMKNNKACKELVQIRALSCWY